MSSQKVSASRNQEFALHVLKHVRRDGPPRFTIGIWEGPQLRAICHVRSLSGALLAISGELNAVGQGDETRFKCPRWSEISQLVRRLATRSDADCILAADYLEDQHAQFQEVAVELELAQQRLSAFSRLIATAAAGTVTAGTISNSCNQIAIPSDLWSQLLALHRDAQEASKVSRESQILRELLALQPDA